MFPKMNQLVILLALPCLALAFPHDSDFPHDHNFLDLITSIAASIKPNSMADETAKLAPEEMLSCVSKKELEKIHHVCEDLPMDQHDHKPPMMTAECVLVDLIKALDNATGILNITNLKTNTIGLASISADQKVKASSSLESCIESNFTLTPPPHFKTDKTHQGHPTNLMHKYENRNNPLRAMVCLAKSLIENGCSNAKADRVARNVNVNINSESGERSTYDETEDDSGTHENFF